MIFVNTEIDLSMEVMIDIRRAASLFYNTLKLQSVVKVTLVSDSDDRCKGKCTGSEIELNVTSSYMETIEDVLMALAHEMTHVQQYRQGKLVQVGSINSWNGIEYHPDHNYLDLPWEIEARKSEEVLYELFISKYSLLSQSDSSILATY